MNSSTEIDDAKTGNSKVDDSKIENVKAILELCDIEGTLASPINLNMSEMQVIDLNVLQWFNYGVVPKKVKLTNTGHTVILSAKWHRERPFLMSGPFLSKYIFSQIHFHWGATGMIGSEHYIDGGRMPMELHMVHFKNEFSSLATALRNKEGVTILVYLFKIQDTSNPFLEEIISALPFIRQAHSSVRLVPMKIMNITRPFEKDYFLYWGSINTDTMLHTVLWLISREPVGISIAQIAEFRTLRDNNNELLLANCRQLQRKDGRHIFHVCPGGSRYATLLPIPRESTHVISKEGTVEDRVIVEES